MTVVRISTTSGRVRVMAEHRYDIAVDGHATVEEAEDFTTVAVDDSARIAPW